VKGGSDLIRDSNGEEIDVGGYLFLYRLVTRRHGCRHRDGAASLGPWRTRSLRKAVRPQRISRFEFRL